MAILKPTKLSETSMQTGACRLSYPNLFQPRAMEGGDPRYSCVLLIPKTDKATIGMIEECITAARKAAIGKGVDPKVAPKLKVTFRDGDGDKPDGTEYGEECHGMMVLNVSSKNKPKIFERSGAEMLDQSELYGGCWVRANVNFAPYVLPTNKGVSCFVNSVQKYKDGEPFGGAVNNNMDAIEDDDEDDLF